MANLRRIDAMLFLKPNDEVAILPRKGAAPSEVFEIAIVAYAGPALIELTDGRVYCANNGQNIGAEADGWIVAATDEHRQAFRRKLR